MITLNKGGYEMYPKVFLYLDSMSSSQNILNKTQTTPQSKLNKEQSDKALSTKNTLEGVVMS